MSDIAIYLGYLVLYAILHSLLATEAVKQTASRRLGRAYAGYRFVYVVLSVGLLLPLLWLPEPEGIGYTVEGLPPWGSERSRVQRSSGSSGPRQRQVSGSDATPHGS
ncbi:MAG: hypothetical protein CME26_16390 [Gemmatimonadetes bacterium]|nr:hypothetical protein [Gemmatimonadota bacterium]|tara:strand:+ start:4459 stop:4779 length:321 start_codon:yes stop_codon:yes gene_type:complete